MSRFLKYFLLWLLMAALPVQGMAAIIKANCGTRHHTSFSVGMAAPEKAMAQEHVHGAHFSDAQAEAASEWAETKAAEAKNSLTNSGELPNHSASYCSACAACCTGAVAPPVSISAVPVADSVGGAVVYLPDSYLGFIPAGLERPPKSFSA
jgi:hypothetical protein